MTVGKKNFRKKLVMEGGQRREKINENTKL
jgi:hypothetical protein